MCYICFVVYILWKLVLKLWYELWIKLFSTSKLFVSFTNSWKQISVAIFSNQFLAILGFCFLNMSSTLKSRTTTYHSQGRIQDCFFGWEAFFGGEGGTRKLQKWVYIIFGTFLRVRRNFGEGWAKPGNSSHLDTALVIHIFFCRQAWPWWDSGIKCKYRLCLAPYGVNQFLRYKGDFAFSKMFWNKKKIYTSEVPTVNLPLPHCLRSVLLHLYIF